MSSQFVRTYNLCMHLHIHDLNAATHWVEEWSDGMCSTGSLLMQFSVKVTVEVVLMLKCLVWRSP